MPLPPSSSAPRRAVRHCFYRSKCLVKLSFQAQTAVFSKRALRIRSPVTLCSVTFKTITYWQVASSFLKCFFMTLYFSCTVSLRFELKCFEPQCNVMIMDMFECIFRIKCFNMTFCDIEGHQKVKKNLYYKFTTMRTKFYSL